MEIEGIKIDDTVDITDKVCPLTFVKAKVAMEELEIGQVLAVTMNSAPMPRSIPAWQHRYTSRTIPLPVVFSFCAGAALPFVSLISFYAVLRVAVPATSSAS